MSAELQFEGDVSDGDRQDLGSFLQLEAIRGRGSLLQRVAARPLYLAILCALAAGFLIVLTRSMGVPEPGVMMLVFAGFLLLFSASSRRARSVRAGHHAFGLGDAGLHHVATGCDEVVRWRDVRAVDETERHLFIQLRAERAFIVPKRWLDAAALDHVRQALAAHTGARVVPPEGLEPSTR